MYNKITKQIKQQKNMKKSSRILVAVIILTATITTSCTTAKHNCSAYGHKTINVKSAFTCATF